MNRGGWYDAGDCDIPTQSQYATAMGLVQEGKEDILQQIEHGAIALLEQHKAVGYAIPELDMEESDGFYSGKPDDRWVLRADPTH